MSLYIASLNSGSNGNCYYVGNGEEAVLVDAGISCRETEKRMKRLGLDLGKVKAIFISHEHIDHIRGMQGLASKHHLPVYISAPTLQRSHIIISGSQVNPLQHCEPVQLGGLSVTGFNKLHDAADPYSFIVKGNGVTVGVFTDIGAPCEHLVSHFRQCHAAFLEANYDEYMLENGGYPTHLKNRIRGGHGHLSNRQALELFTAHRPAHLSHLLLAHLSKNNNTPELVAQTFSPYAKELNIVVASRYKESEVYHVTAGPVKVQPRAARQEVIQVTLF